MEGVGDQQCNKIVEFIGRNAFNTYDSEMNNKGTFRVVAYTKGNLNTLLTDNKCLKYESQIAIYPGIAPQDPLSTSRAAYEAKSVTKLMINTTYIGDNGK